MSPEPPQAVAVQDAPARGRLLVVDDDRDFALSLARLLELEGYRVAVAHDGRGATERLAGIDVALVDIRLGNEDGVQLAAGLRRLRPDLLVVMVTAYASVQTATRALQVGVYDYVTKPFEPDDLLATLARCFDRLRLVREREEAEEQLRRSRRMEAIGQLAAGIAHDFNNLLAVVVGSLRLAQEEAGRAADRNALLDELLADALNAASEGVEANRRLLAVGRAQPLLPRRIDLTAMLAESVRLLRRALGEHIALELDLPPPPCPVHVDGHQLEVSLLNLVLNARDALGATGRVRLAVEPCEMGAGSPLLLGDMAAGPYVRVTVEDNGRGMTAEVIERALTPFFSTKPPEYGGGLGLSTVYGFVRQSGGNLTIDSEVGAGTRVSLLLPAPRPAG